MYNNNIRTDSEIHKFINSEFRNDRLRLEWALIHKCFVSFDAAEFRELFLIEWRGSGAVHGIRNGTG